MVLVLLFCCFSTVKSQELSHQVLVTIAGINQSSALEFSYTVGESAIETINSGNIMLTQGFQQPRIFLKSDVIPAGNGVDIYPNPVDDVISIELFGDSARSFTVEIMNLTGVVMISDRFSYEDNYYELRHYDAVGLTRGLYLIRILSSDLRINRIFKIEKM